MRARFIDGMIQRHDPRIRLLSAEMKLTIHGPGYAVERKIGGGECQGLCCLDDMFRSETTDLMS